MELLLLQFLNGLASASTLFLVAAGLSIIFGVTRIVNFAHGSFFMLGAYVAYTLVSALSPHLGTGAGYWAALLLAALAIGLIGAAMEVLLLRRVYRAPELLQLLATFGVVLIVQDAVLLLWGPDDLLSPRAPGLAGAIPIFGQLFPQYDVMLILLGPAVLGGLWLLFKRTHWGTLVRAATQDREMVSALGVDQAWLFTSVFFLGSVLAGLGGALQLPREAVSHSMDLTIVVEAFVVVVIGGLGSVPGAFLASVIIGELQAFGILVFPQITLVLVFLVMAVVLVLRPRGLLGTPEAPLHATPASIERPIRPLSSVGRIAAAAGLGLLLLLPVVAGPYALSVATEVLIFALFAVSLHLVMGTGGMASFGHAAYFGLGAYAAALLVQDLQLRMEAALVLAPLAAAIGGLVYGWFCVRLSGVYLAMLTLAFAQITYAVVFQWYGFTGGDNGVLGVWPPRWLSQPMPFYLFTLAVCALAILAVRRVVFAPFGYALRAARDSALRAESIGIDTGRHRWMGFALGGFFAGIAGALFAFLKGSVFPESLSISSSVDGLVMVLLGGIQTLSGPILGAALYKLLRILVSSTTDYWRLVLGVVIIALVVASPQGVGGWIAEALERRLAAKAPAA